MNCKFAQRVSECRTSNSCVNKLRYLLNQNYFLREYIFTSYHSLFWCFEKQNKLLLQRFLCVFLCFLTFYPNHQTWGISKQFFSVRCFKFSSSRSSPSELFLGKVFLKIIIKFTEEHPCRSVISIKFASNVTEITLWHGCSPVNMLHIFRTSFP